MSTNCEKLDIPVMDLTLFPYSEAVIFVTNLQYIQTPKAVETNTIDIIIKGSQYNTHTCLKK